MSYGRYSDDPLEDSLFRDEEMRLQQETDEELKRSGDDNDPKGSLSAGIVIIGLMVAFFLWFFFG